MKKLHRVISMVLLICTLINIAPLQNVYANTASLTSAKMINFFKTNDSNITMKNISEGELRVYGVFLSNFLTPGETQLKDLNSDSDTGQNLANEIADIFLQDTSNSSKVVELNKLIYDSAILSIKQGRLNDKDGNAITGKQLLHGMGQARATDNDESTKIYRDGQVIIDFENNAFRGAFKILAAQSALFVFEESYGIAGMSSFYIDCFGNIWGAYPETVVVNNLEEEGETQPSDLHLVLPASLNPLSLLNTTTGSDMKNLKIPLNNSLAMGSLITSEGIKDEIGTTEEPLVPYYNLPKYFTDDKYNVLYIYGLNPSTPWVTNTNKIYNANIGTDEEKESKLAEIEQITNTSLENFYSKNFNTSENYSIIFANRLDLVEKDLENGKGLFKGTGDERINIIRYLYDTIKIGINDTYSTMYYFGDSTASWAETDFKDLGMTGVNMFAYKDGSNWIIHDNNQKAPLITKKFKENRNVSTVAELNALIGADSTDINVKAVDSVKSTMSNASVVAGLFGVGKYVFIQGLSTYSDTILYENLINLEIKDDFKDSRQKFALYNTLNNYTVSGAKFNGKKVKNNIEISKGSGSPISVTATNQRVGYEANWPGIFWGYMVEMFDMANMITDNGDGTSTYGIRDFDSSFLPKLPDGIVDGGSLTLAPLSSESGVANSAELTMEELQKDLVKKIYNIVSDKHDPYRDRWIKTTLDGFLISTHKAITGSWIGNIATVSSESFTSYTSITGFINTPSLYDLPFTSWIMNNYMQIYILLLLLVLIFCILMVLLNMRSWRQGVVIFFIMTVTLMLPNILIENTINIGNKVADNIYSDRFDYWALTQHQHSILKLKGAGDVNSLEYLLTSTGEQAKNVYSQESGVRVKWMAPKKSGVFTNLFSNKYASDKLVANLNIFKLFFSSFVYQQEFVSNDPFATYLYRPYNSIATDAYEYYNAAKTKLSNEVSNNSQTLNIRLNNDENEVEDVSISTNDSLSYIYEGINRETDDYNDRFKDDFYGSLLSLDGYNYLKSDNVFNIYWGQDKHNDITNITNKYYLPSVTDLEKQKKNTVSLWGLGSEKITDVILTDGKLGGPEGPGLPNLSTSLSSSLDSDELHRVGFYKNTESPFYYFYNVLKFRYGDVDEGSGTFRNELLKSDNWVVGQESLQSSSKNVTNTVRDYLDLEGLFTHIIPYMTMSNDYIYGWTSVHGTSIPEFDFGNDNTRPEAGSSDYQRWNEMKTLKSGMEQVWNMYSPWVDQLNSLDIHNEKVGIGGKRVRVENTLNPSYYLKAGRPMIFSEADMIAKGYNESDLSDIERRIQAVLSTTYRDLQYLVNYYDMDDDVLLTAAAMYATFNFNREFSQNGIIGETVMLYPQGFEMKNFNYDAFMRLVMLNSTGETLYSEDGDLYERVLSKTSFFTGLLLLITDILGVIIIPAMKIIILLLMLLLGLLLCITCVITPPEKLLEAILKSLMLPALLFLVSNVVFAYVVSLLVGDGITTYVGAKNISISTQDPTVTIALMVIIDIVYCIALFKIIKLLINNTKFYGAATALAGLGIIGSAAMAGVSKVKDTVSKTGATVGGAVMGSAMAGKGNRVQGAVDGASIGARGGSVYNQRRKEQRLAESGMGTGNSNITDDINKKASGQGGTKTDVGGGNGENNNNEDVKLGKFKHEKIKGATKLANIGGAGAFMYYKTKDTLDSAGHNIKMGLGHTKRFANNTAEVIKDLPNKPEKYLDKTGEGVDKYIDNYRKKTNARSAARIAKYEAKFGDKKVDTNTEKPKEVTSEKPKQSKKTDKNIVTTKGNTETILNGLYKQTESGLYVPNK